MKYCRFAALLVFVFLLAGTAAAQSPQEPPQWNQFRGPAGDGIAGDRGLPLEFGEEQHLKWKSKIDGKAWSSPVVWGRQIWLTNAPADGKQMFAMCFDLATGKVLHNVVVFSPEEPQFCHPMNSYATPTPVLEEGRAYVHFGVHGTACIDAQSGEVLWRRDDLECNHFRGPASSPILFGDVLIVAFDGYDVQYVVALDKQTGKTAWRHARAFDYQTNNGDAKKAYCTATVVTHGGKPQVVCPAAAATEALDPETGELLWTVRHGGMNASARPIYDGERIYLSNGSGKQLFAIRPASAEGEAEVDWQLGKSIPKKSSPVLVDGLLYLASDDGVASCVEAATGEVVWSKRLGGEFAASPIYADGRIYFFSREGRIPIIAAGREFKLLAENQLDDGFMASPAVAGKSLLLRTATHLYCFEK
jgi:outer membrane protein assembly factor BamB